MVTRAAITEPPAAAVRTEAALVLVLGPFLMLTGRILLVPLSDEDWGQTLAEVADHRVRSDVGWTMCLVACGLLAYGSVVIAGRMREAGHRAPATVLGILLSLGWTAGAALCVAGVSMGVASAQPDRATMIAFQEAMAASPGVMAIFALTALGGLAHVGLAILAARTQVITPATAVLLGLGGLLTLPSTPGPVRSLLIGSAGLLLAAHVLALRRTIEHPSNEREHP